MTAQGWGTSSTGTVVFTGNPPIQIPAGAAAGDVLTSDASGNVAWQAPWLGGGVPGDFTIGGELSVGGGSSTAASAPQYTLTLAAGTAGQLPDTSRDYQCYLQTATSGTFSLAIGPTSTPAVTLFASATVAAAQMVSFRLPASWFILFAGTATLASQQAIGC